MKTDENNENGPATAINTVGAPNRGEFEISNLQFAIPQIPQRILDHAERCYPTALRPHCPILGKLFDQGKHDCIQTRLRIEAEETVRQKPIATTPTQFATSNLKSEIPQPTPNTLQPPKTQPEHILNKPRTEPEQTLNTPGTEAEQTANTSQTKPEQPDTPSQTNPPHVVPSRSHADGSPLAPDPDLAQIEEEIIERTHAKSPLDHLPLDHQALLNDLLSRFQYRQVKAAIALPPPNGLGVSVSLGALVNFKRRYAKRDQSQKKREIGRIAYDILKEPAAADEAYVQCSERLLKIRLLETINNPQSKTGEIRDLYQTVQRLQTHVLAQKRHALAERKLFA
jgi:hypothetical protein